MLRPYIQLYIDGKEIDFTEPININMTYAHTDLHNPTVVKNSFSKTLKIAGTPNNNRIFGCFGNMDRIVAFKDGEYIGAYFNPSRKVDFALVRNGEQIERGYVKLDKVTKKGKQLSYDITLYGGLGQFLYNLQYKEDGEKMKLSDLDYGYEMDFEVNKNVVKGAWQHITGMKTDSTGIYDHINFAPCYNGIPENFSADKVAINVSSFSSDEDLYNSFIKSTNGYGLVDGWLIGELKKEYDEWQVGDLRSYLQRPVIRFKDIIGACCNPDNNGGYEVELDEEFFSADNPYYENAWMTLPLITEMEIDNNTLEVEIANTNGQIKINSGVVSGDKIRFEVPFKLSAESDRAISDDYRRLFTGVWSGMLNVKSNTAYYVQLVAYNSKGNVIAGSNVLSFYTSVGTMSSFVYNLEYYAPVNEITGDFFREKGEPNFTFEGQQVYDNHIHTLGIDVNYEEGMYFKLVLKQSLIEELSTGYGGILFTSTSSRAIPMVDAQIYANFNTNDIVLSIKEKSGKKVTKKHLLNSENTPCDYFLSYLKMFNLHIWSDNIDKKVYIKQRKNYFIDNVINIDNLVDRNSDITIKPIVYDAKWYNFNTEFDGDSLLNKTYKDNYGFDYGIQKVNTNYNFDSSSKDLLEKSVFKNCICQRAKSKYYVSSRYLKSNSAFDVPSYYLDGYKTYLFNNSGDTTEGSTITPKTADVSRMWWGEKYYDFMPKPEFRDKDGKGVDGANVLLFYNGRILMEDISGNTLNISITDDIPQFEKLNDGEPCWIWTYNWQLATNTTIGGKPYYGDGYIPCFSRYITNENGRVTHSWDFGTPKELYIPDYTIDNSSDIYTNYWKNYINDEFDINTREVELKVLLKGKVNPDFLQNFVYYDGGIWKIMEIVDYNPCSQECTKVKMVKVQDKNNYLT